MFPSKSCNTNTAMQNMENNIERVVVKCKGVTNFAKPFAPDENGGGEFTQSGGHFEVSLDTGVEKIADHSTNGPRKFSKTAERKKEKM